MDSAPHTLYDLPVSNNGARCRMVLYYKEVPEEEVNIVSPMDIGGLKSEEFLKYNPQGKMPTLVLADGTNVPESDTIARFLGATYKDRPGPDLFPSDPLKSALSDRICRHHDLYLAQFQGCLYKAFPAGQGYSIFSDRLEAVDKLVKELEVLETYVDPTGPYLTAAHPTHADCAVFPTLLFCEKLMPFFDRSFTDALGPKLTAWWSHVTAGDGRDPVCDKVASEIRPALDGWEAKGRWATIRGAGLRDTAEATIFDKIIAKEIPADVVYEDDKCLAFRDVNPVAPSHLLLIPKVRNGLTQLRHADDEHAALLGHLMSKVGVVAEAGGLEGQGFRVVVNDGVDACQSVFHLHLHIIGGRSLTWPPG